MKLSIDQSLDWIKTRRSIFPKEFEVGEVTQAEIYQLLEAARWAPTHKSTEPWRFAVFQGEAKTQVSDLQCAAFVNAKGSSEEVEAKTAKFRFIAERSQAIIAIIMHRDEQKRLPKHEEEWAVACAVQNVHLHAASLEIGMYWSTGAATNLPEIRALLNLGSDDLHMGWMYVGRYTQRKERVKERRSVDDMTTWNEGV